MDAPLWPFLIYAIVVVLLAAAMIAVSHVLGQHHREPATGQAYESGVPATGSARLRFSVDYYLVAMFFVVFDVESIFIFAWAIAWRELGWAGYVAVLIFIGIMLAALVYLWRLGALDWGTTKRLAERDRRKADGDHTV
jgi:NADH-quinone oxidoreductase subunit A